MDGLCIARLYSNSYLIVLSYRIFLYQLLLKSFNTNCKSFEIVSLVIVVSTHYCVQYTIPTTWKKREYLNSKRSKRQCVRDERAVLVLVCLCLWLCMCEWHIFVLSSSTPSTSAHFDMQIEWRIFPMYSDKFINNLYGINRTKRTDEQPSSNIQCTKIYTMLQWMSSVPENGFIHSLWSFIRSLAYIARKKKKQWGSK